jgi:2,3-bisphosphoglycerate-independent phosphoglycerate mutase
VSSDNVATFGERAARRGAIGEIQGVEIMPALMDLARA